MPVNPLLQLGTFSAEPNQTVLLVLFKMASMRGRLRHGTATDRCLVACTGYCQGWTIHDAYPSYGIPGLIKLNQC